MTLYEMSEAAKHLYELLEAGEIDEQTVIDTMESIGASEKLEAYIHVQRQIEAEISAFDAEIERMKNRKHALEKQVERLKNATVDFMRATGQKKATAGTFTLTVRESKSCGIYDEKHITKEYLREIPAKYEIDKKAILAALKEGKDVPGAVLQTNYSVIAR